MSDLLNRTQHKDYPCTVAAEYTDLLRDYWYHQQEERGEEALIRAADLGKRLVRENTPPEAVGELQQRALRMIAAEVAPLPLHEVARRLTPPLTEVLMAYGLAFRQQVEQHYQTLIERRLEQNHRMEALGNLAAGIAHDFNTILGVIMGYTEMTLDQVPADTPVQRNLQQVVTATKRARDLVVRILTFCRRCDKPHRRPVCIADILAESLTMLRVTLPPSVVLRTEVANKELAALSDPGEWQQLIMDLTINAVDAMKRRGMISFLLDTLEFPAGIPAFDLPAGEYVRFRVRDTGCGIPADVIPHIFEPFFTTKDVGKGSGLGLSVVYGIVQRMDGAITVHSVEGQGAEFEILCPRHIPEAE